METSRMDPKTTERIRVRYSGASPVPPDHRAAASTAKNALPEITSLKYSAKLSTTYPPPKNSPSNPEASSAAALPKTASVPRAASTATSPTLFSKKTPIRRTSTANPNATSSGRIATKVCPVITSFLLSRSGRPRPPAAAR